MPNDTTVEFQNPAFRDEMTELIRAHAQTAIRQAVLAELEAFLGEQDDTDLQGRRNVVRNGYQPERQVLTGVGPVSVQLPKTRDRAGQGRCFRSLVLPPYLKKTRRLEAVLPWLYLKGVSTNDFDEALAAPVLGDSHHSFPDFRTAPFSLAHGSILSNCGASGKVGTVQYGLVGTGYPAGEVDRSTARQITDQISLPADMSSARQALYRKAGIRVG